MKSDTYFYLVIYICIAVFNQSRASEEIESVRAITKEWVAVERTISSEAVAWLEKQTLLEDLTVTTKAEVDKIQSALVQIEATRSAVDSLRKELLTQQESLHKDREIILNFLSGMEPQLKTLEKRLPKPLQKKLASLYQRLPEDPSETALGAAERMQTVVSILTGIHEFDRTITVSNEIRLLADGTEGEVQSVYVGLGAAYYKTRSGEDAGIGYPNSQGWEWESQPELNEAVAEVIAIVNQSTQEMRFIDLPVALQN